MSCTLVLLRFYLTWQTCLLDKLLIHAHESCSMTWDGSGQVLAQGTYQHVAWLLLYTYFPSAHSVQCPTTLMLPFITLSHADAYVQ